MNPLGGLMSQERDARAHLSAARREHAHAATFENVPNGWLRVTYPVGARTRTDCLPKMEWAQVRAELLAPSGGSLPMPWAELAAYYPTAFWLYYYYGLGPGDLEGLVSE